MSEKIIGIDFVLHGSFRRSNFSVAERHKKCHKTDATKQSMTFIDSAAVPEIYCYIENFMQ